MEPISRVRNTIERNIAMNKPFGPWTIQIDIAGNPQLSAFWRRRMARLPAAYRTTVRMTWPASAFLVSVAVVMGALPTFRGQPVLAEPAGASAPPKPDAEPQAEFRRLAAPILQAQNAKYKSTIEIRGQTRTAEVMVRAPNRNRTESEMFGGFKMVTIMDLEKGKTLLLVPNQKTATVTTLTNRRKEMGAGDWFLDIRSLLLDARDTPGLKWEPLGAKDIDGRRAVGYRLSGPGLRDRWPRGMGVSLWGDPKTGLPVRIEIESRDPGMEYKLSLSGFVLNVDLDESLFSVEPPAGYTVDRQQYDASPTEEKDLVETLRQYSRHGGGVFPDKLDVRDASRFKGKFTVGRKSGKEPNEQQTKEAMQKELEARIKLTKGLTFLDQLPPEADAYYAGKGVARGAADRPIFWYRPKDAKNYRVIYADLSVREAAAPPKVPDAQPLGKGTSP